MANRSRGRTEGRRLLRELLSRETQEAVAAAIGAKQQYVSRWKAGTDRPKPPFRDALARVYGLPTIAWYTPDELAVARGSEPSLPVDESGEHAASPVQPTGTS